MVSLRFVIGMPSDFWAFRALTFQAVCNSGLKPFSYWNWDSCIATWVCTWGGREMPNFVCLSMNTWIGSILLSVDICASLFSLRVEHTISKRTQASQSIPCGQPAALLCSLGLIFLPFKSWENSQWLEDVWDQTPYVEFFPILVQNLAGTDGCIESFWSLKRFFVVWFGLWVLYFFFFPSKHGYAGILRFKYVKMD